MSSPGFGEEIVASIRAPSSPLYRLPSLSCPTARQREILQLVAEGRTAKEIASVLNVSLQTVASHKTSDHG